MTCRLNVLYKCMNFHQNTGYQVIDGTRFCDRRTDRREEKNNMSHDPEEGRHKYHALQFDDIYDISLDQNFKKHFTYTDIREYCQNLHTSLVLNPFSAM